MLKKMVGDLKLLGKHLKNENEILKERNAELQEDIEKNGQRGIINYSNVQQSDVGNSICRSYMVRC